MSERRTGPWTKEEHAETSARLARVNDEEGGIDVDTFDALMGEAVWMGSEALPRALAEIERLNRAASGFGEDAQAINAEVEKRANDLCAEHVSFGLGTAFWRGIVRPGVEREVKLKISSDAGWAIAKARLECLDKLNAEIARLTSAPDLRSAAMAAELFGGAGEVEGLRARHAKAQAEADDLAQALREHPDAKPEDKPAVPETQLAKLRRETFERIAALPVGKRHKAAARAARSFSVPQSCIEQNGCRIEGAVMVWPDGERYPTRPGFGGVEQMRVAFDTFDAAINTAQGACHNHEQWGPEQWDPITQARTDFYQAYESIPKP